MKVTIKTKLDFEDVILNDIYFFPISSNDKFISFFDKNGKVKYMIDRDYIVAIIWEEK